MSSSPIYWCSSQVWILKSKSQASPREDPLCFARHDITDHIPSASGNFCLAPCFVSWEEWFRPMWPKVFLESDSWLVPKLLGNIYEGRALEAKMFHSKDLLLSIYRSISLDIYRKSKREAFGAFYSRSAQVEGVVGSHKAFRRVFFPYPIDWIVWQFRILKELV